MHSAPGADHVVAGRYRLAEPLGRGAMGIVWRGRDELLDRDVAIKQIVLSPLTSQTEAQASYQRTLREAKTAARLSHPGVVTVFDVVEEDGAPWIVMELIRARPLDQVITEDGPLPPAQAAQLGLSLLDALTTAHAAGVLHRDIKPSNVLISSEGKAVLTDFGIATFQGDPSMTQAGMVVGTPGFAPPERIRGVAATTASDLWSLGATLYAAVEGRGPFDRAGGSAAIVASVASEPAPRAPSAGPLAGVIEALLRADPDGRPDASTTRQLLTEAWTSARRLDPGGRFQAQLTAAGHAGQSPLAGPAREPGASIDATTATQVVIVAAGDEAGDEALGARSAVGQPSPPAGDPAPPPGSRGLPQVAVSAGATTGAATGVVPDLMATPVFAELRMPTQTATAPSAAGPVASSGPAGPAGPAGLAGPGRAGPGRAGPGRDPGLAGGPGVQQGGRRPGRPSLPLGSRRSAVFLAALAAASAVTAIVYFAFPGFPDRLAQALSQHPQAAISLGAPNGPGGDKGAAGHHHRGQSTHQGGASGQTPSPGASRKHGVPGPSPRPSGSQSPSPSPSPHSSPTPSPTPSPSRTPGSLPPGFSWRSVSAATAGSTAGFRVAVPTPWLVIPGLVTTFKPLLGPGRLVVSMTPFAVQGPVREARHLQTQALVRHLWPRYHLVSILAVTFRSRPAAIWTFWWRSRPGVAATDVVKLLYTARTKVGPQSYILTISAPAPRAGWASHIFRVAMRTFRPLP
jgi:eukaryotic-like serine/threonine-protein kinase